jgi:branched-chain amino acid transport system substrate-binding protein
MARRITRRHFLTSGLAAAGGAALVGTWDAVRPVVYAQGTKPIRIGAETILSGPYGGYGQFAEWGGRLAVEEINRAGGILGREVQIDFRDEEFKAATTVKNVRYHVQEWGADVVIGVDSSGDVLAAAEVMPQLDRILIVHHAATEKLNEVEVYQKKNRHVFRISVPVYQDGIASALVAKDFYNVKRWATVSPDYEYGYTSWRLFRETLSHFRPDVQYVAEAWAKFNTSDFSSHISKVMAAKPDGIFSTQWGGEAVAFVRQAKLFGVFNQIKVMMIGMGAAMDVLEGLGRDYPDGVWASCRYWFQYPATQLNRQFVARFQERWKHYPSYVSETMYSCVYAAKAAIEKSHSTRTADLIAALEGMTLETPAGRRVFRREDHQAVYEVPWGRIAHPANYPMPVIEHTRVFPATEYYRWPPFTKLFGT